MAQSYINSLNLNQDSNFPYLVMDVINTQSYPQSSGFRVMHWHEDLQFVYVFSGKIKVTTLNETILLDAHEGLFINKNVVHMVENVGDCHYNSIRFPVYFLTFYSGSPIQNLISDVILHKQFTIYPLRLNVPWNRSVLYQLRKLSELEKQKDQYYTYEVLVTLNNLWLNFLKNINLPTMSTSDTVNERMNLFLHYINEHYSEDISLAQLAAGAQVSKSECLRCFRHSLQTTPMQYLNEIRLSKAAEMLKNTSLSIGEIASQTGFHQLSYFGRCFKQKMQCTPRAYREHHQSRDDKRSRI